MNKQEIFEAINFMHNTDLSVFANKEKAEETVDFITAILQQQLNNGWMPVDSKLPDDTGYYLITNKGGRVEYIWYKSSESKWYLFNSDIEHVNVVAWRHLPEPY